MSRPFSTPDHYRGGSNGNYPSRFNHDAAQANAPHVHEELEYLRSENVQLRSLCGELEQALHEATQEGDANNAEERLRKYEELIEEKTETIRHLHQELQNLQAA